MAAGSSFIDHTTNKRDSYLQTNRYPYVAGSLLASLQAIAS